MSALKLGASKVGYPDIGKLWLAGAQMILECNEAVDLIQSSAALDHHVTDFADFRSTLLWTASLFGGDNIHSNRSDAHAHTTSIPFHDHHCCTEEDSL